MSTRRPIDWRRAAWTALRFSLCGAAWVLTRGGGMLQSCGDLLATFGTHCNPTTPDPRRE